MAFFTKESKIFIKAKLTVSKSCLLGLLGFMIFCILRDDHIYRVVQNYWYCEGKCGCGNCFIDATPPKSYMSFFFHKNNIFQPFTSWKFHKYCAKFWKIMSVKWIILHPYFRNDNFSKDRNYSFLIEILFTKLS